MTGTSYAAALVLAAVFAWAGIAKARRPRTTAATFAGLGLPTRLAVVVPAVELAVAAALVVVPGWAAVAALALLAAFTTVLAGAVRRGVAVGCGCFGSARQQPVSAVELLRNALLGGAAVVALGADGPAAIGLDDAVLVTTATAVGAVVLALADLRNRTGRLLDVGLEQA